MLREGLPGAVEQGYLSLLAAAVSPTLDNGNTAPKATESTDLKECHV